MRRRSKPMNKSSQRRPTIGKAGTTSAMRAARLEDHEGGVEALRRAVELSPYPRLCGSITQPRSNMPVGSRKRSAEYRRMAADFPDDAKSLRELFALLKRQYRDEDAHEAIEEAVRRAPDDLELVLGLASHRLTRHRHAAAEEAYRRAIAIDPGTRSAISVSPRCWTRPTAPMSSPPWSRRRKRPRLHRRG